MTKARVLLAALIASGACTAQPAESPASAPAIANTTTVPVPGPAPSSPPVAQATTPAGSTENEPKLAVEAEGLRWFLPPTGSARPIGFGTSQAQVLASMERVRGPAGKGKNQDCGAGPVDYANWPDGLSLVFQRGKFVGWGLDGRATGVLSTANGVGPGTTRAVLDEAFGTLRVEQTTLGTEFAAGAIQGVLDGAGPNATVTDMWAGVNCVAR